MIKHQRGATKTFKAFCVIGMMGTHLTNEMYSDAPAHTGTQTHMWCPDTLACTQIYHLLSCGKSSRCKLWPWHEGSEVKKFVFPDLPLIIYSWNKEEGVERRGEGERQRGIPQCDAFDVENKISFLICPLMEYTWHNLSSYTLSASSSPFFLFSWVDLFVFTCAVHVCVWCSNVCEIGRE